MGIDVKRFTVEIASDLICTICSGVLKDPAECGNCQSGFCSACISQWKEKCPNGCELSLGPPHRILKSLLSKLPVFCRFRDRGCEVIVMLAELEIHEESECEFRDIQCMREGCGQFFLAAEYREHEKTCVFRTVPCGNCGASLKEIEQNEHSCGKMLSEMIRTLSEQATDNENAVLELKNTFAAANTIEIEHPGVVCSNCNETIRGVRNICVACIGYNLCWRCRPIAHHGHENYIQLIAPGTHENVACDGCSILHIPELRFKCKSCDDFGTVYADFCHECMLTKEHPHEFQVWCPYFISIKPIPQLSLCCRRRKKFHREWMVENLGLEPINNPVLICTGGDPRSNPYSVNTYEIFTKVEIPPKASKVIAIREKIVGKHKGLFSSEWRLTTQDRRSFFGGSLKYEVLVT